MAHETGMEHDHDDPREEEMRDRPFFDFNEEDEEEEHEPDLDVVEDEDSDEFEAHMRGDAPLAEEVEAPTFPAHHIRMVKARRRAGWGVVSGPTVGLVDEGEVVLMAEDEARLRADFEIVEETEDFTRELDDGFPDEDVDEGK